jgi:hypothetical protein
MAFSVTATKQATDDLGLFNSEEIMWLPMDPGVAFTRGEFASMSNGVLIAGAADAQCPIRVLATKTASAATGNAFTSPRGLDVANRTADLTLMPCQVLANKEPMFRTKMGNYVDETVVTYSAASRYIECTTGFGADDRPNGAVAYVYEGAGAGEFNVVEDYDHAGGAVNLMLVFHRPFTATLDTTSKVVVFGSDGGAAAISFLGGSGLKDKDEIDVDEVTALDYVHMLNWKTLADFLPKGHTRLARYHTVYNA